MAEVERQEEVKGGGVAHTETMVAEAGAWLLIFVSHK